MSPHWQERKLASGDPEVADVLPLILDSFNYMRHRINPSSSILQTTVEDLRALCDTAELWVLGSPPVACVCLTPGAEALSIGRLAVAPSFQGQGLGTKLMALAESRAREMSLPSLLLQVRVELHENIQFYRQLGFSVSAEGYHPGFVQPTYYSMSKPVSC